MQDTQVDVIHADFLPQGTERREFLAQQPTYWLKRCYQSLRRTVDAELRQYGLTLSQRDVLLTLREEGPMDQGQLRQLLNLEQSSVSRLVEGLVRRSLVDLRAGEMDRRTRIATLTPEGERLLSQTPGSSAIGGTIMTRGMVPEERAELVRLLKICTDNLREHADNESAAAQ